MKKPSCNPGRPQTTMILALLAGGVSGCGQSRPPWETVYPATGTVTYQGRPLAGALITLVPEGGDVPDRVRPTATSSENGSFQLGTFSNADGAPAGEYKAVVLRFPVSNSKENPSARPNDLPGKYARAGTTDLFVEIAEGANEIPVLELK